MEGIRSVRPKIPVIDVFAGPGGLGEGFSAYTQISGEAPFYIALSIEKDKYAYETLLLRTFFRLLSITGDPSDYYQYLRGKISRDCLYENHLDLFERAREIAWNFELGGSPSKHIEVEMRIESKIGREKKWALIGGPPCQAYSLIGRSRVKNSEPEKYENDSRHFLYQEYLRIVSDHSPPVFIMENVKGLLSTTIRGRNMFERIIEDLRMPRVATGLEPSNNPKLTYDIYSISSEKSAGTLNPGDYVVRSEKFGIPQMRHRVFLFGVRSDMGTLHSFEHVLLPVKSSVSVKDVISDLPSIRSRVSGGDKDSNIAWKIAVKGIKKLSWFKKLKADDPLKVEIQENIDNLEAVNLSQGGEFIEAFVSPSKYSEWYADALLGGVCNHIARGHIISDLHRYLFASSFAKVNGRSPTLDDFPFELLPDHKNAKSGDEGIIFKDRFRVQVKQNPSSTITSHISKDGHYYIHYDPAQCRSFTVREAARVQTFPDNYYFEGPRTAQYVQVGNAVPPLLASKIAGIIYNILST